WEAYARNPDCRITCTLDTQIRAVALGADGRRQSGAATLFGDFSDFPAITWTGSHFALFTSWLYSGPVSARLFSPAGKPVGDPVVIAKQGNHAAVGHDGSAILLLWRDVEGRSFRLNLTPDLVLLSRPIVLSNQLARSWPASSSYDTVAVSSDASAMVYHLRTAESPEAAPALVIETPETAPRGRWRTAVR
ncbi:MAG TPA: hypothetical protein VFV54_00015, partial [Thermoanaerobaculia bacterium]|nr:hypothetical protein [Thermoanaerobaculia bacterium]